MIHYKKALVILFAFSGFLQTNAQFSKKMIVQVPVADLRYQPEANDPNLKLPTSDQTNPLQITQLLLGEHVMAHEEFIDKNQTTWLKVNTLQQQFYHIPNGWHGYPGWIQADQLIAVEHFPSHNIVVKQYVAHVFDKNDQTIFTISIGTKLTGTQITPDLWEIVLPTGQTGFIRNTDIYTIDPIIHETIDELRQNITTTSLKFLGDFYSWGGRSAQCDTRISSVDCSALVSLSFLAQGLQLPRMSHEQFLHAHKIEHGSELQPGDLIFFVSISKHVTRMDHVMLYLGNDQIIETTYKDDHVARIISCQNRLGKPCNMIYAGDIADDHGYQFYIYFGSFLQDLELLQKLRNNALRSTY